MIDINEKFIKMNPIVLRFLVVSTVGLLFIGFVFSIATLFKKIDNTEINYSEYLVLTNTIKQECPNSADKFKHHFNDNVIVISEYRQILKECRTSRKRAIINNLFKNDEILRQ